MSREVMWTKLIVEEFISLASLSKDEEAVMRTRAAGYTITEQSIALGMSTRKIDRIVRRLKIKYDLVQPHSVLLPPRKHSERERFMDTH